MEKKWSIPTADSLNVTALQQALKIHPVLCNLLSQRGVTDFNNAKDFFRPQLHLLNSPWLMKDMEKATNRIITAFEQQEKILVFGDYDVDGTTAVSAMYLFLKKQYAHLDFYIPHRYHEGYGISRAGIDFAKANNFTLIIALDCGIKSVELIAYANTLNIDFIICDHHLPDAELPNAVAILNPKQTDCFYPYKELCGCGVGFKLIQALCERLELAIENAYECLDLVATAIAADIVPITGENRILAFYGLKKVNENPNKGIAALINLNKLTKSLHISGLVFMIAPRINAAGRMDDARKAVQLFIADTAEEALTYAEMLHSDNTDRKEADSSITEEALALISENKEWQKRKTTVVFKEHWHKGVVGIVASRVIEQHYKPTVVLTKSGNYAAGSARSVPGFNLYEAIHACREYLIGYGGHFAAAGLTLELDKIEAFSQKFESVVSATILPEQLIPEIIIDAEINFRDITAVFYNIILQMEPFGPENMRPVFICKNVTDTGYSKIVKEKHLRFSLKHQETVLTGIGFNMAEKYSLLLLKKPLDIVFTIDENEWNNIKTLQLKMIDFRLSL